MTQLPAERRKGRGPGSVGRGDCTSLRSRAAGSGACSVVLEMGTSLDIKIKRANKVYHAGVSRVGVSAGSVVSRAPRAPGCLRAEQGAPPGATPPGASRARPAARRRLGRGRGGVRGGHMGCIVVHLAP